MSLDWLYQSDPWYELNLWLWRRHLLVNAVPKKIFEADDPVLSETVKLVDVAVRDQVRTINKYLLAKGMPNMGKLAATPGAPYAAPDSMKSKPKRRRERCSRCGHINFSAQCGCSCHKV